MRGPKTATRDHLARGHAQAEAVQLAAQLQVDKELIEAGRLRVSLQTECEVIRDAGVDRTVVKCIIKNVEARSTWYEMGFVLDVLVCPQRALQQARTHTSSGIGRKAVGSGVLIL